MVAFFRAISRTGEDRSLHSKRTSARQPELLGKDELLTSSTTIPQITAISPKAVQTYSQKSLFFFSYLWDAADDPVQDDLVLRAVREQVADVELDTVQKGLALRVEAGASVGIQGVQEQVDLSALDGPRVDVQANNLNLGTGD